MTNEVNSISPAVQTPQALPVVDTKSVARSESGKQVPPPGQVKPEEKAESRPPSEAEVEDAVEILAEHARSIGRELQFEIDSDSGQTLIKVIDPETDEVVRQIPSEEAVERARSNDAAAMNLVDEVV